MGTIALLIFNRKLRIEVNHRKITEEKLKKEKELNETILNIAPYTMYIFDIVEQRNVYANKEIFTSLGYTAEEIQGMRGDFIKELMHPDDFQVWHTQTINRYSRLKDNDYIENEYRMKHRDGTWRWLFSKETVFNRLPDGSPKQLFGITIDITEKKNTEIDKQRLHAHLAQSQKMEAIGILAGGIAHDFNNILGIITGNISYALSHINHDDDLHGTLIDVQEGANQAQNLTQQLLTFSKGGEPIKKVIQMNQLVQDASGFVVSGAKSKCEFNLAPDLWCVEVDPGQLNQVISNIVINAEQSMPNGGVITIQTENAQIDTDTDINVPNGKYIKISIQDQGIGIQNRYIEHIFDPYFTTKQIGSGLGLATSYSIIKNMRDISQYFRKSGMELSFISICRLPKKKHIWQKKNIIINILARVVFSLWTIRNRF
ncbi:MAG: PAS/PAC sensor hybrid histidine kinase [Candidatus Magnetoglobus multicellularis str. Araruama]|uniref:histidine kinase n=1 Tax=Candidatus Magnetoglobus multicellularis str. Araruama TaxID=890399 RepID=A0A1V1P802_9BACT|nr:MAG: PAS/PAC sensor hybrid histidine kinase [Candidatus Magnetoglobus multicellularis str. Araruama]